MPIVAGRASAVRTRRWLVSLVTTAIVAVSFVSIVAAPVQVSAAPVAPVAWAPLSAPNTVVSGSIQQPQSPDAYCPGGLGPCP